MTKTKTKEAKKIKLITKSRITVICVFVLAITGILFWVLFKDNNQNPIILKNNLEIEINSQIRVIDLIQEKKSKVNIINPDEVVDTSVFGPKEIVIKYEEKKKGPQNLPLTITIVDKTKPVISGSENITLTIGTKVDLLENISVSDNSQEELEVQLIGDYNFNEIGTYNLKYSATDSSNNTIEVDFILTIEPYKVRHEGLYYWDDRNNEISIIFSGENEVETKTCRKWGENACSSQKGTYQIKNNKMTITNTHYKVGYEDPQWLKLSSKNVQTLTIKNIDRLEQSSYVYNHMNI